MKFTKLFTLALAIGCAAQLNAGTLDFEDAASFGGDNTAIDSSYFLNNGFNITAVVGNDAGTATDVTFAFEQTGDTDTNAGFIGPNGHDTAVSGDLGSYFLKLGPERLPHMNQEFLQMEISYTDLTLVASGEIWDIDGVEAYQVTAYDADGNVIHTLDSTESGDLNSEPWEFSFAVDPDSGQVIDKVVITSTGSQVGGIGFDNFQANATPLPAALPLGIAGIGAFMIRKRRQSHRGDGLQDTELV